jgi:hypothetical protein
MQFGKVSVKKGCAAFARLWGQEPMFRLLAECYAKARGAEPEACIRRTLYCRKRFWTAFKRKSFESGMNHYPQTNPASSIIQHADQFDWTKRAKQYWNIYKSLF